MIHTDTTNIAAEAEEKARLAAEIAQIEAAMEAQRLQAEIAAIEQQQKALTSAQKPASDTPTKPTGRRKVLKKRLVKKKRKVLRSEKRGLNGSNHSTDSAYTMASTDSSFRTAPSRSVSTDSFRTAPNRSVSTDSFRTAPSRTTSTDSFMTAPFSSEVMSEQEQLEAEIAAMEAAIRKQQALKQQQKPVDPAEAERLKLEAEIQAMETAIREQQAAKNKTPVDPKEAERLRLEAEIKEMERAIQQEAQLQSLARQSSHEIIPIVEEEDDEFQDASEFADDAAPMPSTNNFLASITARASEREQRIESGGDLVMAEHAPEVEAAPKDTQLSTSMAELVAKKAADREKRLEEGGEKKMTVIKEKDEYKKDFNDICAEAAQLGRLTRLNEHTVESVAVEKTQDDVWRSGGLLAIQWRSNHMSVIHEAAAAGNLSKLPETITSNFEEEEQHYDMDEEGLPVSPRMAQLLELNTKVGQGQHKVDKLIQGRKEESGKPDNLLIMPMHCYQSIDEVKLPKKRPPRIDPEKEKQKIKTKLELADALDRPMLSISNDVAARAWERRTRLDRPGGMPKIQEKCPCPYCVAPTPYQTFAYKEKDRLRKTEGYESPDSDAERRRERADKRLARRRAQRAANGLPLDGDSERSGASVGSRTPSIREALATTHKGVGSVMMPNSSSHSNRSGTSGLGRSNPSLGRSNHSDALLGNTSSHSDHLGGNASNHSATSKTKRVEVIAEKETNAVAAEEARKNRVLKRKVRRRLKSGGSSQQGSVDGSTKQRSVSSKNSRNSGKRPPGAAPRLAPVKPPPSISIPSPVAETPVVSAPPEASKQSAPPAANGSKHLAPKKKKGLMRKLFGRKK